MASVYIFNEGSSQLMVLVAHTSCSRENGHHRPGLEPERTFPLLLAGGWNNKDKVPSVVFFFILWYYKTVGRETVFCLSLNV